MRRDALLFDLDGTLTDPRVGITRCIRFALERLSVPCPPEDVLATFIGPPLRASFATLLHTADAARIEEAMALYRERFSTAGLFENEMYPGVTEMLAEVARAGLACFVATSKPAVFAERILEYFGLARCFRGVYGAELGGRFDDKSDLLAHLLSREALPPGHAVMVGDRAADVVAARANGLRSIGVLWGYGSERELVDAGATTLCARPEDLMPALEECDKAPPLAPPQGGD